MPRASHTTCIEFAVAMPEHTPGPLMALSAMSRNCSGESLPKLACTEPKNTSSMSTWWPFTSPEG